MTYSIEQMERRTETLRRRRDVLKADDGPAPHLLRGAYLADLNEALSIINELAGRLSASEEISERYYEKKRRR